MVSCGQSTFFGVLGKEEMRTNRLLPVVSCVEWVVVLVYSSYDPLAFGEPGGGRGI